MAGVTTPSGIGSVAPFRSMRAALAEVRTCLADAPTGTAFVSSWPSGAVRFFQAKTRTGRTRTVRVPIVEIDVDAIYRRGDA